MATELEILLEIRNLLSQLVYLQRIVTLETMKHEVSQITKDDRAMQVLGESSESRSAREVAAAAKIPSTTVQRLWRRLARVGLMREDPTTPGRFVPLFAPSDIEAIARDQ